MVLFSPALQPCLFSFLRFLWIFSFLDIFDSLYVALLRHCHQLAVLVIHPINLHKLSEY